MGNHHGELTSQEQRLVVRLWQRRRSEGRSNETLQSGSTEFRSAHAADEQTILDRYTRFRFYFV